MEFSSLLSDLQEYVTFSILHKYASYVDAEAENLKKKLLKPLAGMFSREMWQIKCANNTHDRKKIFY